MGINAIISAGLSWGYSYPIASRQSSGSSGNTRPAQELDEDTKREVEKLKKTDQEVKTHEQAHMSAGGGHVKGGASYEYQTGPDGNRYAVGGEVSIDTSPVKGDPAATIRKMQAVRSAALAPSNPSAQDRAVAAQAAQAAASAMAELSQKQVGTPGGQKDGPGGAGEKSPLGMYSSKGVQKTLPIATGLFLNLIA